MSTLESLLRPVANVLNDNISVITPARELCRKLDQTTVAVHVKNTALVAYFRIDDEVIDLATEIDEQPDVEITASMLTLARIAASPDTEGSRDGSIELSGDAEKALNFQQLLYYAKPDMEEGLATIVGDAAAHRLGVMARDFGNWTSNARAIMRANVREYLQEESRELPSRHEVDQLDSDIDTLRDDVERLAARIDKLLDSD